MSACDVPDCPAYAFGRSRYCPLHQQAMTAEQACCVKAVCAICRRVFKKTDFVMREQVKRTLRKKAGDVFGYRHVACEPAAPRVTKQVVRESEKPLFREL